MLETSHLLIEFVSVMCIALSILFFFYWIKQPAVVAYIVAGAVAGPFGLAVITDAGLIEVLGEFGVIMLLFFIGMEISVKSLLENWRVVILGSICQVLGSVAMIALLGHFFDWEWSRIVVLGFVISLSSTAVLLSSLQAKGLIESRVGRDVVGVLLVQDLLIVPMLILISSLGGAFQAHTLVLQIVGMVVIGIALYFVLKKDLKLPHFERLHAGTERDHQLFIALIFCFGAALVASIFHLSVGLGAFVGGVVAANIHNFGWIKQELQAFKTLFLALFFVSIGLLIDIDFLLDNLLFVALILLSVFLINTFVNSVIFLWLRRSWQYSLYAGALLAPLGEFSFLIAMAGLQTGAINLYGYQMSVIVIALSLIFSPVWTWVFRRCQQD